MGEPNFQNLYNDAIYQRDEARLERDRLKAELEQAKYYHGNEMRDRLAAQLEADRYKAALEKYGACQPSCDSNLRPRRGKCDCGYDDALRGTTEASPASTPWSRGNCSKCLSPVAKGAMCEKCYGPRQSKET